MAQEPGGNARAWESAITDLEVSYDWPCCARSAKPALHIAVFPGLVALLLGIALGTIVLNFAISLKILSNAFLNGLGPFW